MGIGRHLERAHGVDDRLHNLTLEAPERLTPRIDFNRILTPDVLRTLEEKFAFDTDYIEEDFENDDIVGELGVQAELCANIKLLHPSGNLQFPQKDYGIYRTLLDTVRGGEEGWWWNFLRLASHAKRIDPSFDAGVTQEDFSYILKGFADARKKSWNHAEHFASSLRILDPSKAVSFADDEFKKMERVILAMDQNDPEALLEFAGALADLRLIAHPTYRPPLTDRVLEQMEQDLLEYKQMQDWIAFADLAASLKIITAYKVEITGPGKIEITPNPPDLKQNPKPRPERKSV